MDGRPDPGQGPQAGDGAAVGAGTPEGPARGTGEASAAAGWQEMPPDGQLSGPPPAGLASPDGGVPGPPGGKEKENGKDAAAAAGDQYAEQSRAEVTRVYIYDNRSYGVYAEGTIKARDISGHDKTVTSGAKPETSRQAGRTVSVVAVAEQDRNRLRRVIVSVGQRERAATILERERLVVLHGPAGIGKGAAGLWLLGFDHEVLSVDPSLTARDLADFRQRFPSGPQRRYLVEALPPATAAQLSSFVMRTLARDLGSDDSYLVVTVDDRIPLSPDLGGYVIPWPDRPDTALALRAHLDYYLTDGAATSVEGRYDLEQVCAGLADRRLGSVDEVARIVADAFKASRPFESLLDDLGFGAPARVAQWFAGEHSIEDIGLLLGATVLGGCPYSTVARHARRLEQLIADATRIKLAKRPADPLRSRSRRLHEAMAVLEPGFVDTEYGQSPAEMVQLENRWLVRAVLETVWREYDLLGDTLLRWLCEAGDDPDPGVRLRAAAAAGWLSQYEFATLRRRLFIPWARGSSEAARAAADALGQAAWLESTAPLALGLLSVWARQQDDYDLWWTAAVAYGGETGVRYPGVAMDQLLIIADRDDDRAPLIVTHALVRLMTSGGRFAADIAAYVLAHLTRWLQYSPVAALTAQRAYVELLRRASDPDWPSSRSYLQLLAAAGNQDASADLLRAAMADRAFRQQALESVELLVRAGDNDKEVREELAGLLTRVAGAPASTDTDRQRLLHYLNRWAQGSDPSPAARDLANRLQEVAVS